MNDSGTDLHCTITCLSFVTRFGARIHIVKLQFEDEQQDPMAPSVISRRSITVPKIPREVYVDDELLIALSFWPPLVMILDRVKNRGVILNLPGELGVSAELCIRFGG